MLERLSFHQGEVFYFTINVKLLRYPPFSLLFLVYIRISNMFINKVFGIDRIFQKNFSLYFELSNTVLRDAGHLLFIILRAFSCHLSTRSFMFSCLFSLPKCSNAWGTILPTLVLQHGVCIFPLHRIPGDSNRKESA